MVNRLFKLFLIIFDKGVPVMLDKILEKRQ